MNLKPPPPIVNVGDGYSEKKYRNESSLQNDLKPGAEIPKENLQFFRDPSSALESVEHYCNFLSGLHPSL